MKVDITGKKTALMIASVSNDLTIVIKTKDGVKEFQPFYMPKKFDELYIYHAPTVRNKDLEVDTVFVNHNSPIININGNAVCYNWTFKNMPGCLDESGSKPYETLPYFV